MSDTEDTLPNAPADADTPQAEPEDTLDSVPESSDDPTEDTDSEAETTADGDTEEGPPLEELKKGYLRQQDYTRKAQELAEQRRQAEAERAEFAKLRDTRLQQADAAINLAAATLQADFQKVDWNTLAQTDPAEYVRKQHEFSTRQQQLSQAYQTLQQQKAEKDREEAQSRQQRLASQERALLTAIPEWNDPAKRAAEVQQIRTFANTELGIDDQTLEWISENGTAGMVQALRDAMLYRRVQKQLPKPKPQTAAPPPPAPVKSKAPAAKDPEKMDPDEWLKWRNAQLRRKSR